MIVDIFRPSELVVSGKGDRWMKVIFTQIGTSIE